MPIFEQLLASPRKAQWLHDVLAALELKIVAARGRHGFDVVRERR